MRAVSSFPGHQLTTAPACSPVAKIKSGRSNWVNESGAMQEIRVLHSKILENVSASRSRMQLVLQNQERDMVRAFRAKLYDVQTELERERNKCVHAAGRRIASK